MPTLSHNIAVRHLINGRSAKEGTSLTRQFIFFSLVWILITTSIGYLGRDNFSTDYPTSWLMLLLPLMGVYMFIIGLQCQHYWQGMGKASLYLAKNSFHCNDNIRGYVEFKDLNWNGHCVAVVHISLKKRQTSGHYKEEWITKAESQTAPGNKGIRVSFSSQVRPTLGEKPSSKHYTWCLHISLEHNKQRYRENFEIPMSKDT